jgi:hypothetical protein
MNKKLSDRLEKRVSDKRLELIQKIKLKKAALASKY